MDFFFQSCFRLEELEITEFPRAQKKGFPCFSCECERIKSTAKEFNKNHMLESYGFGYTS